MATFEGRGFDRHDVRLYEPHYIHRLCQDNDSTALRHTLASDKTGVNLRDQTGKTPLQLTVINADPPYLDEMMQLLIRSGADLNARVTDSGDTALHLAILYSKLDNAEVSVPILLYEGAAPAVRNFLGKTPFDYAVGNNFRDLAALLAAVEADPSVAKQLDPYKEAQPSTQQQQQQQLNDAIRRGNTTEAGRLVAQVSNQGLPLHTAVLHSPNKPEMVRQLAQSGANVSAVDENGETPITLAIQRLQHNQHMLLTIHQLLQVKVPKETKNSSGESALSLSRSLGYSDVQQLLVTGQLPSSQRPPERQATPPQQQRQQQPKPTAGDPNQFTGPHHELHRLALQKEKLEETMAQEVRDIFRRHSTLNPDLVTKDEFGDTALHIATRRQKAAVVRALLDCGSTVSVKNKKRETPLSLARDGPWGFHREIEDMLTQQNRKQIAQRRMQRMQMAAQAAGRFRQAGAAA